MIRKTYTVTGLPVDADYSSKEIDDLFVPLLKHFITLRKNKGDRLIVYLAAPPGSGKTTLSLFLEDLYKNLDTPFTFQAISMDGFHHYNQYLDKQTIVRNGQSFPLRTFKGIPESFNVAYLTHSVTNLQTEKGVEWPTYDRLLHDVSEHTIEVDADIVLIEGNYLLLDKECWRDLIKLSDYSVFIDTEIATLEDRLIDRKQRGGASLKEAQQHYERTDKVNAELVLGHSLPADQTLWLNANGRFTEKEKR